jgi:hypothetical protein
MLLISRIVTVLCSSVAFAQNVSFSSLDQSDSESESSVDDNGEIIKKFTVTFCNPISSSSTTEFTKESGDCNSNNHPPSEVKLLKGKQNENNNRNEEQNQNRSANKTIKPSESKKFLEQIEITQNSTFQSENSEDK